jgi:tRNA-specific 2-thiouridylase
VAPRSGTVTVGPAEALDVDTLRTGPASWAGPRRVGSFRALAQVRAHGAPVGCRVDPAGDGWAVTLEQPLRGVAPGQTLALYEVDQVLGAATVLAAGPDAA